MIGVAKATRTRHKVVTAAFFLATVLYLDRAALSVMAPVIRQDLGFSPMAMGWVFSAFVWGYALFHIPFGWLGDIAGPRRVLSGIVLLWSAFTAATAAAWNLASMLAIRFLFGAAEAGAAPNVTRAFSRWIPPGERARAQGFFLSGMSAGGALAPPLTAALLVLWGWRVTFVLLGGLGVIWAAAWYAWFTDHPANHKSVNQAELTLIASAQPANRAASISWRRLLGSANLRAILLMYFTYGYTGYIYITWFPSYLVEGRRLSVAMMGFLAALPTGLGMIAKPLGGWWSDWAAAKHGLAFGRRVVGMAGFGLAALAVIPGILVSNAYASALLLAVADGGAALAHGVCFAVCLDIGAGRAGTVSALMLTAGSLGNVLSALAFGASLQYLGSWTPPFLIGVAANLAGALLWLAIDPKKQLV
ncbi:MAG: MFS transporter [Bryobacteraceae bacterium]|nr:MFS transporter [Bryobacteraceae bacterium]